MLFLLALVALATAQYDPPVGCNAANTQCYMAIIIDTTGFSNALTASFTTQTGGALSTFTPTGTTLRTYKMGVPFAVTTVNVTFREGATFYSTQVVWNPQNTSSYTQTITSHRATFRLHLEGYNPGNVGNQLPSMLPNTWAVKLTTGTDRQVFREYYNDATGNFQSCTSNGALPLSQIVAGQTPPFSTFFSVVVLPYSDIGARVLEAVNSACPSTAGPYVDCHQTPYTNTAYGSIGPGYNKDCTSGSCDSGLCVTPLEIPSSCDWTATIPSYTGVRRGIQPGSLLNLNITWAANAANNYQNELYRQVPQLPWGTNWITYVLAVNNYVSSASFPSLAAAPVSLSGQATNCADGQQCELLPLSTIARIDIGQYFATVVATQGPVTVGGPDVVNGENYYCILNLPLLVTATYDGPIQVVRSAQPDPATGRCLGVDQFCNLGPFYVWATPQWDCWGSNTGLTSSSYPSQGIQYFVYYQTPTTVVWPPANTLPLSWQRPLPLLASQQQWQVPSGNWSYTLRIQEGNCGNVGGGPAPLQTCQFFDAPLTRSFGPNYLLSNYSTDLVGRILGAFDLFYLPLAADVQLLNAAPLPNMLIFRDTPNQGTAPQCYCVLPIQLFARINEAAACWKSPQISCVTYQRPTLQYDCELCDFLSIMRFDLRGLPTLTTNAVLRVSPQVPAQNNFFVPNTPADLAGANFKATKQCQNGATQGPLFYPAGTSPPGLSVSTFSVVQSDSPLFDGFSFSVVVPAYTSTIRILTTATLYNTFSNPHIDDSLAGGQITVTGTVSGQVLNTFALNAPRGSFANSVTPNLNVIPGETVTVCFTGLGGHVTATPLLSSITVQGDTFAATIVRNLPQVGNVFNNVTVLRSCNCDLPGPQQYWLAVTDNNQAVLEQPTTCCGCGACTFQNPFTCTACLNLTDPCTAAQRTYTAVGDNATVTCTAGQHPWPAGLRVYTAYSTPVPATVTPGVGVFNPTVPMDNWASTYYDGCGYGPFDPTLNQGRFTVSLFTQAGTSPFRTIARQGGFDGCAQQANCNPYGIPQCPNSPMYNPINALGDRKRAEYVIPANQAFWDTYWNGNSYYTVLCLPYQVQIAEYGLSKTVSLDCSKGPSCRNSLPLLASLQVSTVCEGYVTEPFNAPAQHSGDSMQLYENATNSGWLQYPGIGFDITLLDQNGVQFRGKRSKLFLPNCTFQQWAWSSATCLDCGYRRNCFSVLAVPGVQVQLVENPYRDRPVQYPDQRVYPRITRTTDCSSGSCSVPTSTLFSRINVASNRGAPSANINGLWPYVVVKFGNVVQQPIRLIHESYVFTDGRNNAICVVADNSAQYALNWGYAWASNNAGNFFCDCSVAATPVPSDSQNCRCPNQPPITTSSLGNPVGGNYIVVPPAKRSDEPAPADETMRLLKQRIH